MKDETAARQHLVPFCHLQLRHMEYGCELGQIMYLNFSDVFEGRAYVNVLGRERRFLYVL